MADPHEVFVFNISPDDTGASAVWAAQVGFIDTLSVFATCITQRVPDEEITVVANEFTVG